MQTEYPQYFRKAGRIIRQDDPLNTWTITLQPEAKVAMRYHTQWPSAERLAQELAGMEPATAEKFKEFAATFYQQVAKERQQMNEIKEQTQSPLLSPRASSEAQAVGEHGR